MLRDNSLKKWNYAIEMIGISKKFGSIVANDKVALQVKKGDIHAIVGENGAGKSTLMSVLFGINEPDAGYIKINGKEVDIKNPIHANELGIGMVHQHFQLVHNYTALENIALSNIPVTNLKIPWVMNLSQAKSKILVLMKKYNFHFDLKTTVENSPISTQQKIEIMKMLYQNSEILIFDEPTAVLNPSEIKEFLKIIKHFKTLGKTIILITHKLKEIEEAADMVTILRAGKSIKTFPNKTLSLSEVANLMVGRSVKTIRNNYSKISDKKILEIKNISVKKTMNQKGLALDNLSLNINAGEILAIAGVEGNGQVELAEVLMGMQKLQSGSINLDKREISKLNTKKRYNIGMSYVPEDRHRYGIILDFPISDNFVLQNYDRQPFSNCFGILRKSFIKNYSENIIKNYDIRGVRHHTQLIRSLSGGNQQKVVIGREIERKHKLIIFSQPTRGLDVGAIEYIHEKILQEKSKGNAVLLISYELDEVLALADTIAVLNSGKIVGLKAAKNITREQIAILMINKNNLQKENVYE